MNTHSTRERLVAAAAELFYSRGITASGVDAVVSRAGISKPTLYSHYRSKSELVAAALQFQHQERRQAVETYLAQRSDAAPGERLLSVFDWLGGWYAKQGTRGCAFLNAAVELVGPEDEPARQVVRQHKYWWREFLSGLARDAGVSDPSTLGDDLLLLMDGVSARVLVTGDASAATAARRIAGILLREYRPLGDPSPKEMTLGLSLPSPTQASCDGNSLETDS